MRLTGIHSLGSPTCWTSRFSARTRDAPPHLFDHTRRKLHALFSFLRSNDPCNRAELHRSTFIRASSIARRICCMGVGTQGHPLRAVLVSGVTRISLLHLSRLI